MESIRKIINDPVYGFITIDDPLIFEVISHPFYQRLRRIHQMAFAELVYPGAVHSRLHHSLGAYHLMYNALAELKNKGIEITPEEEQAAKLFKINFPLHLIFLRTDTINRFSISLSAVNWMLTGWIILPATVSLPECQKE